MIQPKSVGIHIPKTTAAVANDYLRSTWRYADALNDVRLPFSPALWEFAAMDPTLRVNKTLLGKIRIRGYHEDVTAVLKMFLATQLGSEHIA